MSQFKYHAESFRGSIAPHTHPVPRYWVLYYPNSARPYTSDSWAAHKFWSLAELLDFVYGYLEPKPLPPLDDKPKRHPGYGPGWAGTWVPGTTRGANYGDVVPDPWPDHSDDPDRLRVPVPLETDDSEAARWHARYPHSSYPIERKTWAALDLGEKHADFVDERAKVVVEGV